MLYVQTVGTGCIWSRPWQKLEVIQRVYRALGTKTDHPPGENMIVQGQRDTSWGGGWRTRTNGKGLENLIYFTRYSKIYRPFLGRGFFLGSPKKNLTIRPQLVNSNWGVGPPKMNKNFTIHKIQIGFSFFYPSFKSFTHMGGGWFVFDPLVDFVFWLPGMLGMKFVVETLSETEKNTFLFKYFFWHPRWHVQGKNRHLAQTMHRKILFMVQKSCTTWDV